MSNERNTDQKPPPGHGQYGIRKSKGFTGRKSGKLFWRGRKWTGPSNLMGRPDLAEGRRQARVAAEQD